MGISVTALRQVDWESVEQAAKGWKLLADQSTFARDDITQRGTKPLDEHWTDATGEQAGQYLRKLADSYDCAGLLLNSVGMILYGLADSLEVAQDQLTSATDFAAREGFRIEDNGSLTYVGADEEKANRLRGQISGMVADALEAATQADTLARDQLTRLTAMVGTTDPSTAANVNNSASQAQIQLMTYSIPHGQPSSVVAEWWAGLSEAQRCEVKLAAPLDLYELPGIPDDVKRELSGPGPYNRMEVLRYARDHWNDSSIDHYDNNCTSFVSYAIQAGGAEEFNEDDWLIWDSDTDWYQPDKYPTDSKAWSQAQASHDFMVRHGGQEITVNTAQPGDIVYWRNPDGHIHHAAMVTSVTPDGDIHYTQHSGSMQNGSLDGRLSQTERDGGNQGVVFVRPNPNW